MFTYRNTAPHTLYVINVGSADPNKTIDSPVELNHPNLELVKAKKENAKPQA
jgi:hypothetical protein